MKIGTDTLYMETVMELGPFLGAKTDPGLRPTFTTRIYAAHSSTSRPGFLVTLHPYLRDVTSRLAFVTSANGFVFGCTEVTGRIVGMTRIQPRLPEISQGRRISRR